MHVLIYFFIYTVFAITRAISVPPEACFANFRWDDCGQDPVPVMYYWKPGSRCEVGLWRGCLPNINMFRDEYECVSTCIFTARAMPEDYHNLFGDDVESNAGTVPLDDVTTPVTENNGTDLTTAAGEDKTDEGGATTTGSGDSGTGAADDTGAAGSSGGESSTTPPASPAPPAPAGP